MVNNFDRILDNTGGVRTLFTGLGMISVKDIPESRKNVFENQSRFFTIKLIRRNKDFKNLNLEESCNEIIKTYFISTRDELRDLEKEIKLMCDTFGCRAYISIVPRDPESVIKKMACTIASRIDNETFSKPWRIFDKAISLAKTGTGTRYIIDVDNCSLDSEIIGKYINIIDSCRNDSRRKSGVITDSKAFDRGYVKWTGNKEDIIYDNIICGLPTQSGVHIITHSFDKKDFEKKCDENGLEKPTIFENHLTLLYENTENCTYFDK